MKEVCFMGIEEAVKLYLERVARYFDESDKISHEKEERFAKDIFLKDSDVNHRVSFEQYWQTVKYLESHFIERLKGTA